MTAVSCPATADLPPVVAGRVSPPAHVPASRIVDFDLNRVDLYADDFFEAWRTLHRPGVPDIAWSPHNGGHWMVTRGRWMPGLFADTASLSSREGSLVPGLGELMQLVPVQSDPPDHGAARSAVLKGFGAKMILGIEPEIRQRMRSLAEALKPAGECEFVEAFAEDVPVSVFLSMIDLPLSDRPMLRDLVTAVHRPDGSRTLPDLVAMMHDYLRPYVRARLAMPGEDMMSRIFAAGIGGAPWGEEEAMRLATNLLVGGLDTVAALMGFTMRFLALHPGHRARLVAEPALAPRAADELIRRFGMTSPVRRVIADMEVDDVVLRRGDMIVLPTMLHNLDDRCFPDAMTVDFDRPPGRAMTMGNGAHHCVGAGLARLELVALLQEWLAVIPEFGIDPDRAVTWQGGGVGTLTALPLRW